MRVTKNKRSHPISIYWTPAPQNTNLVVHPAWRSSRSEVRYSTSWLQVAHRVGQCAGIRAIPGLTNEKFLNIVWSTLLMSVPSAYDSRGFSLINSLSKLLQSLGEVCKGGREIFQYMNVLVDLLCLFWHVVL